MTNQNDSEAVAMRRHGTHRARAAVRPLRPRAGRHGFAAAVLACLAWPGSGAALAAPEPRAAVFAVVKMRGTISCGIDRPTALSAEGMLPPAQETDLPSSPSAQETDPPSPPLMGLREACEALRKVPPTECPLLDNDSIQACEAHAGVMLPLRWAAVRAPAAPVHRLVPPAGWQSQGLLLRSPSWQRLFPMFQTRRPGDTSSRVTPLSHVVRCPSDRPVPDQHTLHGWAQLPFLLRMQAGGPTGECGATQLSDGDILTAEHCLPMGWTSNVPMVLTVVQGGQSTPHELRCDHVGPHAMAAVRCSVEPALPCPDGMPQCARPAVAKPPMAGTSPQMLVVGWSHNGQPRAHCVNADQWGLVNTVRRDCEAAPPDEHGTKDLRGAVSQVCTGGPGSLLYLSDQGDSGSPLFAGCEGFEQGGRPVEGVVQRLVGNADRMQFTDFRCP